MKTYYISNGVFNKNELNFFRYKPMPPLEKIIAKKFRKSYGFPFYNIKERKLKEKECDDFFIVKNKNSGILFQAKFGVKFLYKNGEKLMEIGILSCTKDKGEIIKLNEFLSVSDNFVYWRGNIVLGANPKTLVVLNGNYFKDNQNVYYEGLLVKGVKCSEVKVTQDSLIEDKTHIYFKNGQRILKKDGFKPIGDDYFINKGKLYSGGSEVIVPKDININKLSHFKTTLYASEYMKNEYLKNGEVYEEINLITYGGQVYITARSYDEKTNTSTKILKYLFDILEPGKKLINDCYFKAGNRFFDIDDDGKDITSEMNNVDIDSFEACGEYWFHLYFPLFNYEFIRIVAVFKDKNSYLIQDYSEDSLHRFKKMGIIKTLFYKFILKPFFSS